MIVNRNLTVVNDKYLKIRNNTYIRKNTQLISKAKIEIASNIFLFDINNLYILGYFGDFYWLFFLNFFISYNFLY